MNRSMIALALISSTSIAKLEFHHVHKALRLVLVINIDWRDIALYCKDSRVIAYANNAKKL